MLTPRLSSLWLGLVTPLYARVGRQLIDSIRHPTVVTDNSADRLFDVTPVGYREAIRAALRNEDREFAQSRWSDALSAGGPPPGGSSSSPAQRFVDSRAIGVTCSPGELFAAIERIGGNTGWYFGNWLWELRGAIDLLLGGVGLRRGRPHPTQLRVGDTLDCWRVESVVPGRRLLLAAEMKLPGRAWLDFEVSGDSADRNFSHLRQTAVFDPKGLAGRAYWYSIYPLHQFIFAGMLRSIAAATGRSEAGKAPQNARTLRSQALAFLALLLICFGTAAIGASWTSMSLQGWYQTLARPTWTPPDWVFGPVWTVLYFLMAVAGWLVWRRSGIAAARGAWLLFAAQLVLNALWSGIFFAMRSPGLAFVEILVLWAAIAGTSVAFWQHSRWASYLLIPYLAWSSFAAVLNLAIWRLNS